MSYLDAILKDRRTFSEIYISMIKTKQLLLFTFGCKNDFNPRTIKISFFLFIFSLFLVSNTIFINDSLLHELFISNGNSRIISDIPRIFYSAIISSTIKNILILISFPESDILLIRKKSSNLNFKQNQGIQKSISNVIMRCYLYFLINILTLMFIWFYIACFFMVFRNTQFYVIKNALISFVISLIYPFILYIIPSLLKNSALINRGTQGSYCLYILGILFQVLF